jgi:hypothetical protein
LTIEKLLYGRKDAAVALSVSVRSIDYMIAAGEFETRRKGRRVLITAASLRRAANRNSYEPVSSQQPKREVSV